MCARSSVGYSLDDELAAFQHAGKKGMLKVLVDTF